VRYMSINVLREMKKYNARLSTTSKDEKHHSVTVDGVYTNRDRAPNLSHKHKSNSKAFTHTYHKMKTNDIKDEK